MSVSATVNLTNGAADMEVCVDCLKLESCDRHFLVLRLGPDANIILPGFGRDAAAHARVIAQALTAAADAIPADPPAPKDEEVVF